MFLVEETIDVFVLINIYNNNTELEQLETLSSFKSILDKVKGIQNKTIVFEGDFNVIFDISFQNLGVNIHVWRSNQQRNWFKSMKKLIYVKYGHFEKYLNFT